MAAILADDRSLLASVVLGDSPDSGVLAVAHVLKGKGQLLGYYLGKGKRAVLVELGMVSLPGNLESRWDQDERAWQIRLREPVLADLLL